MYHEYKIHSVPEKKNYFKLELKTETEPENQKSILLLRTKKVPSVFGYLLHQEGEDGLHERQKNTQPAAKPSLQGKSTGLGAAQYKEGRAEM